MTTSTSTRLAEARTARDEGMATATNAADPRVVLMVDKAIADANATREPWSCNDIRDAMPTVRPGVIGARVKAASLRRPTEMVKVGEVQSTLRSTKAKTIALWRGVG